MSNRNVVENYCRDLNSEVDIFFKLVNSYRLLVGGASELNQIALATKNDIKNAIKRVDKTGEVIDELLDEMQERDRIYIKYLKIKSENINEILSSEYVENEIEEELK